MAINKDYDSLFFMFFGISNEQVEKSDCKGLILICARKAYRDFCRTIDYSEIKNDEKVALKETLLNILVNEVESLLHNKPDYDAWHKILCLKLTGNANGILHIGQAQKWINMTVKYLRVMGVDLCFAEKDMHVPIDNYIIEAARLSQNEILYEGMDETGAGVTFDGGTPWSKCDRYEVYFKFQKELRERKNNKQVEWEAKAWIAMAMKHATDE